MDEENPGDQRDQEGIETRVGCRATDQPQMRQPGREQTYKKQKIPLATRQRDHFLKGASLKILGG